MVEVFDLATHAAYRIKHLSSLSSISKRSHRCQPGFSPNLDLVYFGDLCYHLAQDHVDVEPIQIPSGSSQNRGAAESTERNNIRPDFSGKLQPAFSACNKFLALCGSALIGKPPEPSSLELYKLDLTRATAQRLGTPSIGLFQASWIHIAFHSHLPLLGVVMWVEQSLEGGHQVLTILTCFVLEMNEDAVAHEIHGCPKKVFDSMRSSALEK